MINLPSFAKSVIVPFEVYESKFGKSNTDQKQEFKTSKDILTSNLPSDLKLKLFNQKKSDRIKKMSSNEKANEPTKPIQKEISLKDKLQESIYELFPSKDKEKVKEIFEFYINKNPYIIDWNVDTNEVIINEKTVENSNIVKILEYLFNPQGKKPIGSYQVYRTLIDVGVPKNWFGNMLIPSPGLSPVISSPSSPFSTPTSWRSLSRSASHTIPSQYSPIASRVKRRTDRRAKTPYSWQNL